MYVDDTTPAGPRLGAHGSVAVELDWVLSAAHGVKRPSAPPALQDLYRAEPGLAEQVAALWGQDEKLSYSGYLELSVLAHRGGMLFSLDSDAFLAALDGLCRQPAGDLELASETAEDRQALLRRLEVLRTSAKRRRHYIEVVTRVWSAARAEWERDGLPAVRREIAAREATLAGRRPSWEEFTADDCKFQSLDRLVAALGADGELAVVPAYFSHKGFLVDLPGVVVVGIGTTGAEGGSREMAELLVPRLKALADPTRLAILAALGRHEMTVTDIARRFDLAQPTVSNHVKALRETGFLSVRNDGRSRYLVVEHDAVAGLGQELKELLGLATCPT